MRYTKFERLLFKLKNETNLQLSTCVSVMSKTGSLVLLTLRKSDHPDHQYLLVTTADSWYRAVTDTLIPISIPCCWSRVIGQLKVIKLYSKADTKLCENVMAGILKGEIDGKSIPNQEAEAA